MSSKPNYARHVVAVSVVATLSAASIAWETPKILKGNSIITNNPLANILKDAVERATTENPELRAELVEETLATVHAQLEKSQYTPVPLRSELGERILGEEEATAIQMSTDDVVKTIMTRVFDHETEVITKGDHGKNIGCFNGIMTVLPASEIPAELQRGVIVPGAVYPVQSRVSNAEIPGRKDRTSLSQGVALKLLNVSSQLKGSKARLPDFPETDAQDFLMTSDPTFFLSNIMEYSVAFGFRNGEKTIGQKALIIANPLYWDRLREEADAKIRNFIPTINTPKSVLVHPYWSKHPYAWGERGEGKRAVKYSVAPCSDKEQMDIIDGHAPNFQEKFIREAFELEEQFCFYFRVQMRPENATEEEFPIEDAYKKWDEVAAPFINVATIVFPKKLNDGSSTGSTEDAWYSTKSQEKCSKTEFNPWNGLMAHQPLSNLARGRRTVYKASSVMRDVAEELNPKLQRLKKIR